MNPHVGRGGVAERHRGAAIAVHPRHLRRPWPWLGPQGRALAVAAAPAAVRASRE